MRARDRRLSVKSMAGERPKVVAIVEDDESMRNALQGLLKVVGLRGLAFASAEEFLDSSEAEGAACLIADVRLPGISGLDLQARLVTRNPKVPILFITAHGDDAVRSRALQAGAALFLNKPFDDETLLRGVRAALDN